MNLKSTALRRLSLFIMIVLMTAGMGLPDAVQGETPPPWYRIRTNSIPHQPAEVIPDTAGGVWVTAIDESEFDPCLWYLSSGTPGDHFEYITNKTENNYLLPAYLDISVVPRLEKVILYAVTDSMGNTWYSLKNRNVLCKKANGDWLTFSMQDTSYYGPDSTNVDSAHRIRLIAGDGGATTGILLISARGLKYVNSQLEVTQTIEAGSQYNNDFINDAFFDSQGRFWFADNRGVAEGTTFYNTEYVATKYPDNPSVPGSGGGDHPITRIAEDTLGNMWFCSNSYGTDGVYCFTGDGAWIKYDLSALVSARNDVTCMAAGNDGTMWFGPMWSGLVRYDPADGGLWRRFAAASLELESENIISMAQGNGRLWFVTDSNPEVSGNGTGVFCATFNPDGSPVLAASYTYRESSTSLTSNRFNFIAADKSGGVWFPAYDDPSVARLKADGTWQQFRETIAGQSLGVSGIVGVGVDSQNRVYFAPQNVLPVAYNVSTDEAIDLPAPPEEDFIYYYSLYIDADDNKWFCGSFGVHCLNADNTAWTRFRHEEIPEISDNYVDSVRVDDSKNVWIMTREGLTLMKKVPDGPAQWYVFKSGDASGYFGGYRVFIDDAGTAWNANKQVFDPQTNTWNYRGDTSAFDHRHLRFTNGWIPADMDLAGALPWVEATDQNRMTLDNRGNIYFAYGMGWLYSVNAGIVVRSPVRGDIDRDGKLDLADAILSAILTIGNTSHIQSGAVDVNGDEKVDTIEFIYMLQNLAGIR